EFTISAFFKKRSRVSDVLLSVREAFHDEHFLFAESETSQMGPFENRTRRLSEAVGQVWGEEGKLGLSQSGGRPSSFAIAFTSGSSVAMSMDFGTASISVVERGKS